MHFSPLRSKSQSFNVASVLSCLHIRLNVVKMWSPCLVFPYACALAYSCKFVTGSAVFFNQDNNLSNEGVVL